MPYKRSIEGKIERGLLLHDGGRRRQEVVGGGALKGLCEDVTVVGEAA